MATGKTTVGRRLAQRLGVAFHDSDAEIERGAAGRTVADLAHSEGVEAMHRREALQLLGHLGAGEPAVLAAAASVVDDPICVDALRSDEVDVVWLRASVATMVARFGSGPHRPTFDQAPDALLAEQWAQRAARFAAVADVIVDVDGRNVDDIVDEVLAALP